MTRERLTDLANNIVVGGTDNYGPSWWYQNGKLGLDSQGRPNHFPGAVPMERVRELMDVHFSPRRVYVDMGLGGLVEDEDRRAWVNDATGEVAAIHSEGYVGHQYGEALIRNTEAILGQGVSVYGAGRLKNSTVAYVQVEMDETLHASGGVDFRPWLMATTSFDGSIATTYKRGFTKVVCDNTREMALSEKGQSYRIKHTRNSELRIKDARVALDILNKAAEEFEAEVDKLLKVQVSDQQWQQFVEAYAPIKTDASQRSITMAENKREELSRLWLGDYRVQPWQGTAYGVVQCVNTFVHHVGIVRGTSRQERNLLRAVEGGASDLDRGTADLLGKVLDLDLAAV